MEGDWVYFWIVFYNTSFSRTALHQWQNSLRPLLLVACPGTSSSSPPPPLSLLFLAPLFFHPNLTHSLSLSFFYILSLSLSLSLFLSFLLFFSVVSYFSLSLISSFFCSISISPSLSFPLFQKIYLFVVKLWGSISLDIKSFDIKNT